MLIFVGVNLKLVSAFTAFSFHIFFPSQKIKKSAGSLHPPHPRLAEEARQLVASPLGDVRADLQSSHGDDRHSDGGDVHRRRDGRKVHLCYLQIERIFPTAHATIASVMGSKKPACHAAESSPADGIANTD